MDFDKISSIDCENCRLRDNFSDWGNVKKKIFLGNQQHYKAILVAKRDGTSKSTNESLLQISFVPSLDLTFVRETW